MSAPRPVVRGVLFDLDGTLIDSAPDLAAALNALLAERGGDPLPYSRLRPLVSGGAARLVEAGFGTGRDHPQFPELRRRFIELYRADLSGRTRLFPGMEQVLAALERRGTPWGIVTNKPGSLTSPLLGKLRLAGRAACVVSGDSTGHAKPHPEPVLHACRGIGVAPAECLFVGDDRRDVEAGRAAGTRTLAALFGYIPDDEDPRRWGADGCVECPRTILEWIGAEPDAG
ncbi:MAG TPA: phosphoglycolate phosphatase [Gammaproteobacteria bacterium]|nr:phosphoglycolate phosphatase [Gammaproteobacteria bacterium]